MRLLLIPSLHVLRVARGVVPRAGTVDAPKSRQSHSGVGRMARSPERAELCDPIATGQPAYGIRIHLPPLKNRLRRETPTPRERGVVTAVVLATAIEVHGQEKRSVRFCT